MTRRHLHLQPEARVTHLLEFVTSGHGRIAMVLKKGKGKGARWPRSATQGAIPANGRLKKFFGKQDQPCLV